MEDQSATPNRQTDSTRATLAQEPPKVLVAMLGARLHYAVPRLLYQAGMLDRFYTDSYAGTKPRFDALVRVIPEGARPSGVRRWLGRRDSALPADKVVSFELLGWRSAWLRWRARSDADAVYAAAAIGSAFNGSIIASGPSQADVVWGFNGASLELFRWARQRGIRCIVEQTIAPRRIEHALLGEEQRRWPGWQPSMEDTSYPDALSEREEEEWKLADLIVAGSKFVAGGLRACGAPPERIRVVPYGVDPERFHSLRRPQPSERLRVLFAGAVNLRKGVPYLLEALHALGAHQIEARFAGHISLDRHVIERFRHVATFLGPVPRSAMTALFNWADVFVLPSIVEGSATVTYEALMAGLPVITTPNAGSIVQDGVNGFLVPIRDSHALADRIKRYQDDHALLDRHRTGAMTNRAKAGLQRYMEDLTAVIDTTAMTLR